ncbi:hypothetical protein PF001_g30605 [Phytophthora fragariae]|uniref:Uncharacterized protein n=1 Tax=Phytophthora fragariae TaxID=53985 RepID=A0A6A4B470_9STRA|nr:hypothetical protein PF001_g30605 [Phytophthora fragariae]
MVYPSSTDTHALESARLYNEAHNLAFAQHLTTKGIPEGGSKAVVLCDPIVGPVGDLAPYPQEYGYSCSGAVLTEVDNACRSKA